MGVLVVVESSSEKSLSRGRLFMGIAILIEAPPVKTNNQNVYNKYIFID